MPWSEKTENKHTLKESEIILEEDHYGLKQVKERILEYLAVQSLIKKNKVRFFVWSVLPGLEKLYRQVGGPRYEPEIFPPVSWWCAG